MEKEIDNILEDFHLGKIDLLEVRKKLLVLYDVRNSASEESLTDECKPGTHDWDYNINPYQKTCKKCNVRYLA